MDAEPATPTDNDRMSRVLRLKSNRLARWSRAAWRLAVLAAGMTLGTLASWWHGQAQGEDVGLFWVWLALAVWAVAWLGYWICRLAAARALAQAALWATKPPLYVEPLALSGYDADDYF